LLHASRRRWPFVQLGYADAACAGPTVSNASPIRIEIVRKPDGQIGFAVHARRGVVERFFAWINRNRRLTKELEATIASAEAFLYVTG
jgi:putative transposase